MDLKRRPGRPGKSDRDAPESKYNSVCVYFFLLFIFMLFYNAISFSNGKFLFYFVYSFRGSQVSWNPEEEEVSLQAGNSGASGDSTLSEVFGTAYSCSSLHQMCKSVLFCAFNNVMDNEISLVL